MSQSPYAPPTSMLAERREMTREDLASTGQRFVNSLIDQIALGMLSGVFGAVAGQNVWIQVFAIFGLPIAYYWPFESFYGYTPGKLLTGNRVVSEDGTEATGVQILKRTLARFIPFEPFSAFRRSGIMWHDSLSKTRVIRSR